jgi:hypothetical protein
MHHITFLINVNLLEFSKATFLQLYSRRFKFFVVSPSSLIRDLQLYVEIQQIYSVPVSFPFSGHRKKKVKE